MLTYVTYATYYLARLNFSVALPAMKSDLGYSTFTFGLIAGVFSLSYAIGQFVNGQLAENLGARNLIFVGLVSSAIINIVFGCTNELILFMILWGINGYAQSTGWPSAVKIIRSWFRPDILGSIGGLFGTCFLIGNMLAWAVLGRVLVSFGWRSLFLIPPLALIVIALVFYLFVSDEPKVHRVVNRADISNARFNLLHIFSSRRLIMIAIAYALLQFVRSGFTLWAPIFVLEKYKLSLDVASYVASVIPLGGIIGSIASGWVSDRMKKFGKTSIIFILTLLLSLTIFTFYDVSSYGLPIGIMLLFSSGFLLYGPHVIMVTVVPMEEKETYGAAGVAGFIDGIGYLSLMLADPLIGWILDLQGWSGVVTFELISSLSAVVLLLTLWRDEVRRIKSP